MEEGKHGTKGVSRLWQTLCNGLAKLRCHFESMFLKWTGDAFVCLVTLSC